ncbi:MAG: hypothetical protein ABJA67_09575 [Chthonomonadales bacterium]
MATTNNKAAFAAISGNGVKVREVLLPHMAYGYIGRESVVRVLYEMVTWFDKYLKKVPPREVNPAVRTENMEQK